MQKVMPPCQSPLFPNFPGRNNAIKPLHGITQFYGSPFEEYHHIPLLAYPCRFLKARRNPACLRHLEIICFASISPPPL